MPIGHGNSVPRFHVTWGTGPGVLEPFVQRVREAEKRGLISFMFRHRVNELTRTGDVVTGVRGDILEPSTIERGRKSSRDIAGDFELKAQAVIVASGGIGANPELVRKNWPQRLGAPPKRMITGVPDHVDGRMLAITETAGGTHHQPRPHVALCRGHQELGADLDRPCASASCPARRRCGSTRAASACRCRSIPASTRWARSATS